MVVDGREITNLPEPPIIVNDSVLVPAREAFENLGASVAWDGNARQIYVIYQNQVLVMTVDHTIAIFNGRFLEMSVPPTLHNDKTMIPLRFPAECFGFGVDWGGEERTAYLYSPIPEPEPEWTPGPEVPHSSTESGRTHEYSHHESPSPAGADPDALARDKSPSEILPMDYPETNIIALLTPRENLSPLYTLQASSPISVVEKFLLADNRLVIDIYNAVCLIGGPFHFDGSVPVTGIRASQFMDFPKVTRLVFDLTGAAEFSVSLSEDRRNLLISFEENIIHEVRFASTGLSDSVTIVGKSQPLVSVTPGNNPDRYIIRITNASMTMTGEEMTRGVFAHRVRVWQQADAGYVEVHVNEWPSFMVEHSENSVTVRFFRNTLTGLRYDYGRREIRLSKQSGLVMNINEVIHTDDYTRNRYTLTLPVNAEAFLGNGELSIRDGFVNSVSVEQEVTGRTRLVINQARVLAYEATETDDAYVFRVVPPRDARPRVVVIDPGHGGSLPGSTSGGLIEKHLNLSIALKLMELLKQDPSITVYTTRMDDRDVSLEERARFANENGDIFVSIHCNALRGNTTSHGAETYFWPHENDAELGFSSEQLAAIIQRNLIVTTGAFDRGVKSDHMTVLRETTIPAVLAEVGFMTNPAEAARLATDEYQWQIAWGLYNGIREAFTVYWPRR
jgi:N-acetylmuramoyl-L-alanine amidase